MPALLFLLSGDQLRRNCIIITAARLAVFFFGGLWTLPTPIN
jgi:hypothetical protein